jgi:hypothetical protein
MGIIVSPRTERFVGRRGGPLARWLTARIVRASFDPPRGPSYSWSSGDDLLVLLRLIIEARDARVAALARRGVAELWASGQSAKERVWKTMWRLFERHGRPGPTLPPAPLIDFLLDPDPDATHRPRLRLTAGMAIDNPWPFGLGVSAASLLLRAAVATEDPSRRGRLAEVFTTTDSPAMLDALNATFTAAMETQIRGYHDDGIWLEDGRTATPLLEIILANPHRPGRPSNNVNLVILDALQGRLDRLADVDPDQLVSTMLRLTHASVGVVAATARRVLRALPEGAARDALCHAASWSGDVAAGDAVRDAGFRPSSPQEVPLFLVLTAQWDQLADLDPTGEALTTAVAAATDPALVDTLLRIIEREGTRMSGTPGSSAQRLAHALGGAGAGLRERLCERAADGDRTATTIVVDSGLVPTDAAMLPAFLFLTQQWTRYDALDPDGSRLQEYGRALPSWSDERTQLRRVAKRVRRPAPCAEAIQVPSTSSRYRPGGTAVGGTGGFSVHV